MQRLHAEEMLERFTVATYPYLEKADARKLWGRYQRTLTILGPSQELDKRGLDALRFKFGRKVKK
jgi:hypothetical protein|tara:strand:+ start:276 stop:470 length:195 start_codon:yes stop_codon:yes gene_type:complete